MCIDLTKSVIQFSKNVPLAMRKFLIDNGSLDNREYCFNFVRFKTFNFV